MPDPTDTPAPVEPGHAETKVELQERRDQACFDFEQRRKRSAGGSWPLKPNEVWHRACEYEHDIARAQGEQEGRRLEAIEREKCTTCGGDPHSHPSGVLCICGDGTRTSETVNLRWELEKALRERKEGRRLEREAIINWLGGLPSEVTSSSIETALDRGDHLQESDDA